jgi:hypothetical protein
MYDHLVPQRITGAPLRVRRRAAMPERLQADLVAVFVLRTTLAALANAEAVDPAAGAPLVRAGLYGDVERRSLASTDVATVVSAERAELIAAARTLDKAGRTGEANACRIRAAILERYLAG